MAMGNDQLINVGPEDWAELRDLYLREWPRYEVAFATVQNFIDWTVQSHLLTEVKFYSLRGSWREDGTIVIASDEYLFIYTLDETLDTLRRALLAFNWDRTYLVAMTCYRSMVLDVFQTLHLETVLDVPNVLFYLHRSQADQFTVELAEGFTTGKISPRHAPLVNDRWRHKGPGTEALIERLLQRNPSMGLYDPRGQLVGWCLYGNNGALSMLGVESKRKGYGSIVIKAFVKHLAQRGLNAYACVISENEPSRALFRKLGFTELRRVDFLGNGVQEN